MINGEYEHELLDSVLVSAICKISSAGAGSGNMWLSIRSSGTRKIIKTCFIVLGSV